jgi:hypothetical protein
MRDYLPILLSLASLTGCATFSVISPNGGYIDPSKGVWLAKTSTFLGLRFSSQEVLFCFADVKTRPMCYRAGGDVDAASIRKAADSAASEVPVATSLPTTPTTSTPPASPGTPSVSLSSQAPSPDTKAAPGHPSGYATTGVTLNVWTSESSISYAFEEARGLAKDIAGRVRVLPDGTMQLQLVFAGKSLELKATIEGVLVPTEYPTTLEQPLRLQLGSRGDKRSVVMPAKLTFESAEMLRVVFKGTENGVMLGADLVFSR